MVLGSAQDCPLPDLPPFPRTGNGGRRLARVAQNMFIATHSPHPGFLSFPRTGNGGRRVAHVAQNMVIATHSPHPGLLSFPRTGNGGRGLAHGAKQGHFNTWCTSPPLNSALWNVAGQGGWSSGLTGLLSDPCRLRGVILESLPGARIAGKAG
jgi:hypothetical protein